MLVHDFLKNAAQTYPDRYAVWFEGAWFTYSEIDEKADKLAAYLTENGIKKGDRISLILDNSIDYVISYFAILKAGAVVVGINPEMPNSALSYQINNSDSKLIIIEQKYLDSLQKFISKWNGSIKYILSQKKNQKAPFPALEQIYESEKTAIPVRSIDQDLAEIVYTSGSTGKPKGVMLSHLNLVSNMRSIVKYLELTKKDRVMVILPFYYIYGKSLLLTHFLAGASIVIDNRFTYPNTIIMTMKETKVTGFAGVPSTFSLLLNCSIINNTRIKSLRYVTQAGGGMAPSLQKKVAKAFFPAKLYIMYGATEAAPRLSYLEPKMLPEKWGSIGKPVDNVELAIVDEKGNKLPPGKVGEIAARGSNIMQGYWKDKEATDRVLVNGYYLTGDLGKQDNDGYFYVVGRKKNFIKTTGYKVSAKSVEDAIMAMQEVQEVAVTGVDDEQLGEAVKAYIKLHDKSLNKDDVLQYLSDKLTKYEIPKYIEFVEKFPKNRSGKILKTKLV